MNEETTSDKTGNGHIERIVTVHALLPFALKSDISDPHNYFNDVLEDGTAVCTEWDTNTQISMKKRLCEISWVKDVIYHRITFSNVQKVLAQIPHSPDVVVMNLVDGQESDGWPGISILRLVEASGIAFTGATSAFFSLDTSKQGIKKHLLETGLTPGYYDLSVEPEDVDYALQQINKLRMPIIVKPSPSSGSRGITGKSVTWDAREALEIARKIRKEFGGCYVEEFIAGREFSALVSGDINCGIKTYVVMERVFSQQVDLYQRFLSYDMKWVEWGLDANSGKKWWPAIAPPEEQAKLQDASRRIYEAVGGCGYCRMDLRMDLQGNVYVVDVNANCSVDCDEGSAMGLILQASDLSLTHFLETMLQYGMQRKLPQIGSGHTAELVD